MPRYVVLYKFTEDGARKIRDTVKRANKVRQENQRLGFKVQDILWTQGPFDMVTIVEAPSEEAMMGAMMNVVSAGNVASTTMRAFNAVEMTKIISETPTPSAVAAPARTAVGAGTRSANGRGRSARRR